MASISLTPELLDLFREIIEHRLTETEWAARESGDYFQTELYCGGYDADEMAFCFSSYIEPNNELWFQFTLEETQKALNGEIKHFEATQAE
jgi:hypothetical protein